MNGMVCVFACICKCIVKHLETLSACLSMGVLFYESRLKVHDSSFGAFCLCSLIKISHI